MSTFGQNWVVLGQLGEMRGSALKTDNYRVKRTKHLREF